MNFQELLDEVEDAMNSPDRAREVLAVKRHHSLNFKDTHKIAQTAKKDQSKNELDDLLDMFSDEDNKSVAIYPLSLKADTSSANNTRSEFQAGGTKKCLQVLMNGGHCSRGLSTAFSSRVCSNLRCNECDFTVVQFPGKKWDSTADYMFFRENTPNEAKLRAKMEVVSGFAAYACQCKWLSINSLTRVDQCRVKWSCAGH